MKITTGVAVLAILTSAPLLAQPRGTSQPGQVRSEMRIQGYYFDNFFHSTSPGAAQNVTGLGAELRAAFRPGARPLEVFGHAGITRYDLDGAPDTFTARLGVGHDDDRHEWTAFVDHAENRPSFEVGNVFGRADVTTLAGQYFYRLTSDWEIGGEGTHQRQRFDGGSGRDNDYNAVGAAVRYRGLGWRVRPEIGVMAGRRSVENAEETYDTREAWLEVVWMPVLPRDPLYLSVRLRDRNRAYTIGNPAARNFGRQEDRFDWTLVADLRTAPNVNWLLYISTERIDSSIPAGDFNVGMLLLGVTIGF